MGEYKYKNGKYLYVYNADNETPNCMMCDHVCGSQEKCDKCGPDYWWQNYERTEVEDSE